MARTISQRVRDEQGVLRVVTLDPATEELIANAASNGEQGMWSRIPSAKLQSLLGTLQSELRGLESQGRPQVILVRPPIRLALHRLIHDRVPDAWILSYNEISKDTRIEAVGMLQRNAARAA
jgi:flagellar biosynthesis protein FlhA